MKFNVMSPSEAEYAKANSDPSYSPKEDCLGELHSDSEQGANRLLDWYISSGKYPKGSRLSDPALYKHTYQTIAHLIASKLTKDELVQLSELLDNDGGNEFGWYIDRETLLTVLLIAKSKIPKVISANEIEHSRYRKRNRKRNA